jgi:short-subunit dehydrogenase
MGVNRNVPMMDARKVAEIGYRGMMRGQRVVIPGVLNKVMSAVARRAPARWTAAAVRRIHGNGK